MDLHVIERAINVAAVYEGPEGSVGGRAVDAKKVDEDWTPALVVAGVPVHVYVKDGVLRVSVHCDAEPALDVLDLFGNVRMEITVNGDTVFKAR